MQGGGGLNGSVQLPLGASADGAQPALARGYAVASTDTGHQGRGGFDASFMQDQQASLDFAYTAIGRVAEIAKRIIAQHYGKTADRSYFAGCSTGGREASSRSTIAEVERPGTRSSTCTVPPSSRTRSRSGSVASS